MKKHNELTVTCYDMTKNNKGIWTIKNIKSVLFNDGELIVLWEHDGIEETETFNMKNLKSTQYISID